MRRLLRSSGQLLAATLMLAAGAGFAADATPADADLERVRDRLAKTLPDIHREDIQRSAAEGLFEVRSGNAFGYVTADGRYLMSGDVVDLDSGARITEHRRNEQRLKTLQSLNDGAIVFAPPNPSRWITVFTDVDCEYCKLLHREVARLNELGVGVRYLFFSSYGAPSLPFDRARTIWCANDRRSALNAAMVAGVVSNRTPTCSDPIQAQYQAAVDMGLRGTPVAVMPDGSVFYGYAKAEALAAAISKPAPAPALQP